MLVHEATVAIQNYQEVVDGRSAVTAVSIVVICKKVSMIDDDLHRRS